MVIEEIHHQTGLNSYKSKLIIDMFCWTEYMLEDLSNRSFIRHVDDSLLIDHEESISKLEKDLSHLESHANRKIDPFEFRLWYLNPFEMFYDWSFIGTIKNILILIMCFYLMPIQLTTLPILILFYLIKKVIYNKNVEKEKNMINEDIIRFDLFLENAKNKIMALRKAKLLMTISEYEVEEENLICDYLQKNSREQMSKLLQLQIEKMINEVMPTPYLLEQYQELGSKIIYSMTDKELYKMILIIKTKHKGEAIKLIPLNRWYIHRR